MKHSRVGSWCHDLGAWRPLREKILDPPLHSISYVHALTQFLDIWVLDNIKFTKLTSILNVKYCVL